MRKLGKMNCYRNDERYNFSNNDNCTKIDKFPQINKCTEINDFTDFNNFTKINKFNEFDNLNDFEFTEVNNFNDFDVTEYITKNIGKNVGKNNGETIKSIDCRVIERENYMNKVNMENKFKPDRCVCLDIYHREIGPDSYEQYKENETLVTTFKQDCAKIKYESYVLFDVLLTPGFGLVNQMIFNGYDGRIELISGSDRIIINCIGAQLTLSRPGTNGSLIPLRPASYEMIKCEGYRSLTTLTGKEICTHVALNGVPRWRGTVDGPRLISIFNDQVSQMLILRFSKCFLIITLPDERFSYTIPIPPIRAFYDFNGQETVIPDEVIELKVSDKNNISFTFDKKIIIKKVKLSNFKLLSESDGFKIKSVEYHDVDKKLIYRTEKEAFTHYLTEGHKNLITKLSEKESSTVLEGVIKQ